MQCLKAALVLPRDHREEAATPIGRALDEAWQALDHSDGTWGPEALWEEILRAAPLLRQQGRHGQHDLFDCFQCLADLGAIRGPCRITTSWLWRCADSGGQCGQAGISVDETLAWTVTLPDEAPGELLRLRDLLEREETRDVALENWVCGCCGAATGCRRIWAREPPSCLVIHLLRFTCKDGAWARSDRGVEIPWDGLSFRSRLPGEPWRELRFCLRAVAAHSGLMGNGHYWACVLWGNTWWVADDSRVAVLDGARAEALHSEAYALFLGREGV